MKQYLSILLRNQFNLFYRFGYIYIPKCQLLEFDGVINESTKENLLKLFSETTPFEWDEEYLILHFDKNEGLKGEVINFQIQDVVKVYPLSAQAKSSIETKIDNRIRLEKPVFENILPKIEETIEKHELEKAIQALWYICEIEDDLNKFISNIGFDNILNGHKRRKLGTKCFQIKDGNYWEYVLAYDRFDFFPNSILGYFYDAGQIFANYKGLSTFEGSGLYKLLQNVNNSNPEIKFKEIIKLLENEEQGKKFVSQTTLNDQLQYIITPLFLMLKDEIRKAEDIKNTSLFKHLKILKKYGSSFNYAVILLGAFFGFKKFYDAYYDNLNLRFYKSYQPVRDKKEEPEKIVSKNQTESNEPTSPKEEPVFDEKQGLEDRPKSEELTISPDLQELKVEPIIQNQPLNEQQSSEEIPTSTEPIVTEVATKPEEQKIGIIDNNDSESKKNIESKKEVEILPTDDIESKASKKLIKPQSNSDTVTVTILKNIINDQLKDKTEVKLTDIGKKAKEITGQKITNAIIKNVIKSMDNVEIVPKKTPETARKIILRDLFNKQV